MPNHTPNPKRSLFRALPSRQALAVKVSHARIDVEQIQERVPPLSHFNGTFATRTGHFTILRIAAGAGALGLEINDHGELLRNGA
jgi:hypothetical protein